MTNRPITKLVHVDEYVAEVDIDLIYAENDWSPYLSVSDAAKLDDVREALKRKDIESASRLARVYKLLPVAV
ncbi:MAG: hypothetical protein DYG87_03130 [Anaerolineae bacterium CFX3]|jgi:hypothetical protein|nr:hypothetical protein [Anaerolineales bacterium]MCE7904777.1 hypothetical protein [Anaerolineae bacterium CFX3]MCQ3945861.1 hypothetical protein [Anaerolineae bacterium]GER81096.1 conserved hypothetical protein [Candidatus Denitrolinea symbiosum]MBW7919238.1 hypothetical protein [Anaerolineales bacterium]